AKDILKTGSGRSSSRDRKPAGVGSLNRRSLNHSIRRTRPLSRVFLVRAFFFRRTRFLPIVSWKVFAGEGRMRSRVRRQMKSWIFLALNCEAAIRLSSCRMADSTTSTTNSWKGFGKGTHEDRAAALFHHV